MNLIRKAFALIGMTAALFVAVIALSAGIANADSVNWDAIAQCESGGNWSTNTGNGFSGGLQFSPATWAAHGGTGSPATATREQQIRVAENVAATQGLSAWPSCGNRGGYSTVVYSTPRTTPTNYLVSTINQFIAALTPRG